MSSETSNDNADAGVHRPDAHGQAAMLLVESLIHGLIEREVITVADAVEIVDIAVDVRADTAADNGESPADQRKSLGLLQVISVSLSRDLPRD